jgi:hypothetical protein
LRSDSRLCNRLIEEINSLPLLEDINTMRDQMLVIVAMEGNRGGQVFKVTMDIIRLRVQ